jgi:hypothetical protein
VKFTAGEIGIVVGGMGLAATLLGALVTQALTQRHERERWQRADRTRWHRERRPLYARYLALASSLPAVKSAILNWAADLQKEDHDAGIFVEPYGPQAGEMQRAFRTTWADVTRTFEEIELIASGPVREAALAILSCLLRVDETVPVEADISTIDVSVAEREFNQARKDLQEAVRDFRSAARLELGVEGQGREGTAVRDRKRETHETDW